MLLFLFVFYFVFLFLFLLFLFVRSSMLRNLCSFSVGGIVTCSASGTPLGLSLFVSAFEESFFLGGGAMNIYIYIGP